MSKLFEQIDDVWESKSTITTKTKPDSLYMTARFISLDPDGFLAACDYNRMHKMPSWAGLPYLKWATPKIKAPRNKYPKKLTEGTQLSEKRKRALHSVCRKFTVPEFHGLQIMKLLEDQGFVLEAH